MLKEFRSLLPYFRKHAARYLPGFLCLMVVDALQLVIPQLTKRAVDTISSGSFGMRSIVLLALAMVLVAFLISTGRFVWRVLIFGSARDIEAELRERLFGRLLALDSGFYQANKTGDLMARATNDLHQVRQACGMGFVTFIDGVFMSAAILAIMFARSARISLLTVIPLPVITLLIIAFGGFVGKRFKVVQDRFSSLSDIAQESVSGIRIIKAFVRERGFDAIFSRANDEYRDANMVLVRVFGFFFPLISFLSGLSMLILLLAGGYSSLANGFSAGDIVAMLSYLTMLIWPMLGAGFMVDTIQRGGASLKRVNEVLDAPIAIADAGDAIPGRPEPSLEVRNLSFTYPGASSPTLADLSFSLQAGKTLGILGRTGSGKSTLLRLLPRLLEPPEGTVFVGGIDARRRRLEDLRSAFGFVPQETFLFSASIRENIVFGCGSLCEERLSQVARISTIARDLEAFPDGMETLVGERGLSLSGGQKQRVAIARALAADPPILVLDDALSAVDTGTEDAILSALAEDRKGKTNILVSHRVSTLRRADLVIVLDGGRVVQAGSPHELLRRKGLYADLARLQKLDAEEGA